MTDKNLIFVISLPRSGSTLLQMLISSHSRISGSSEPWLCFPLLCGLRPDLIPDALYSSGISEVALREFLDCIPDGQETYRTGLRKAALHVYEQYCKTHNGEYFVDKTARYYHIANELEASFPRARFIVLLRHPSAVFLSYIEVMAAGELSRLGLKPVAHDLMEGNRKLMEFANNAKGNKYLLRYEDLVSNPEHTLKEVSAFIGVGYEAGMLNYKEALKDVKGQLTDPKSIRQHEQVAKEYVERWRSHKWDAEARYLLLGYLKHLGCDLVESMGYDYDDALAHAQCRKPFISSFDWGDISKMNHPLPRFKSRWRSEGSVLVKAQMAIRYPHLLMRACRQRR